MEMKESYLCALGDDSDKNGVVKSKMQCGSIAASRAIFSVLIIHLIVSTQVCMILYLEQVIQIVSLI